ncbi:MAG: efflux RND transporter periplasmic adaptor subunit [Anaerohalosphaeraceae bacterium]
MAQNKFGLIRILCGLILIGGGIYAVFFVDWTKTEAEQAPVIRPLKMFTVGQDFSNLIRKYPGKVSAIEKVTLGFQVDGPLIELPIRKGDKIQKGQLLAKIDPRDFQNRLDSTKAELDQTATQLERIKKAAATGAVSKTDLTNAQAAFEQADANYKIAQKAMQDTQLLSPFEGLIANIFVDNYQNVQAKQEIVTIQRGNDILIVVNVPEERIIRTKTTKDKYRFVAVFDSLAGQEFEVKVHEYALEADPMTQTYLITFSMTSPDDIAILPGMTATIWEYPIQAEEQEKTILVPMDAAPVDGSGQYYVWMIKKEADDLYSVQRQDVKIGKIETDKIQILEGLSDGDRIAANGVHMLQEGQKVTEFLPGTREAKP